MTQPELRVLTKTITARAADGRRVERHPGFVFTPTPLADGHQVLLLEPGEIDPAIGVTVSWLAVAARSRPL